MTGPTHAVIGIAATVTYVRLTGDNPGPFGLLLMLCGSLAPDIDGDGSITKPGKLFGRFLPWRTARILDQLGQVVRGIAHAVSGHRGFFHWPVLPIIMILLGVFLPQNWLFWFGWGYLLHILADYCTISGVPLLAPFTKRHYNCTSLRTGSLLEGAMSTLLIIYVCVVGWELLPPATQRGLGDISTWCKETFLAEH